MTFQKRYDKRVTRKVVGEMGLAEQYIIAKTLADSS